MEAEIAWLRSEVRRLTKERDAALASHARLAPDKRQSIMQMLKRGEMSDRQIARAVQVSPTTIGRLRRTLAKD